MLLCAAHYLAHLSAESDAKTRALTDPLISGIANGSTAYKLVGSYVSTPLNWYASANPTAAVSQRNDMQGGDHRHGHQVQEYFRSQRNHDWNFAPGERQPDDGLCNGVATRMADG